MPSSFNNGIACRRNCRSSEKSSKFEHVLERPLPRDELHRVVALDHFDYRCFTSPDPESLLGNFCHEAYRTQTILRTPTWEDFVHLTFTKIRFYSASNIQIARRLRASILDLMSALPAERHPALRRELDLLDKIVEKSYVYPEDLALARIADSQGLGAATSRQNAVVLSETT